MRSQIFLVSPARTQIERKSLDDDFEDINGPILENGLKKNCNPCYKSISYKNLKEYPEDMPPVVIDYKESIFNKDLESTAVNDMEDETGTEVGPCPFVVHGLTGEEYSTKGLKALKAIALKHLTDNKKIAAVGHHKNPESIYNNPQLFPQMMPWLFPYGLGGIGNKLQQGHI